MQIYSLSLGSFWGGAITMFTFALGTLPVLALLSFGASGFHKKIRSDVFFKTAGLVVIFFALINILSALAGAGIIPPLFNL
jgi:sulfite exporter TauE/SafE